MSGFLAGQVPRRNAINEGLVGWRDKVFMAEIPCATARHQKPMFVPSSFMRILLSIAWSACDG
jgi:hypothetical protein